MQAEFSGLGCCYRKVYVQMMEQLCYQWHTIPRIKIVPFKIEPRASRHPASYLPHRSIPAGAHGNSLSFFCDWGDCIDRYDIFAFYLFNTPSSQMCASGSRAGLQPSWLKFRMPVDPLMYRATTAVELLFQLQKPAFLLLFSQGLLCTNTTSHHHTSWNEKPLCDDQKDQMTLLRANEDRNFPGMQAL